MPTLAMELDLPVSAYRIWMTMKDSRAVFPKIAPQIFASVEDVDGTSPAGTVGSERIVKFGPVAPEGAFVKEKVTAVDPESMSMTITEVEGGHLALGFSKWSPSIKIVAVDDKSCKLIASVDYEGGNDAHVERAKEDYVKLFQGVTDYLQTSGAYA